MPDAAGGDGPVPFNPDAGENVSFPPEAFDGPIPFNPDTGENVSFPREAFDPEKERWDLQKFIGKFATWVLFGSLMAVVLVWGIMAIKGDSADQIKNTTEAMQPFLLPTIGAIVGFAVGERLGQSQRDG